MWMCLKQIWRLGGAVPGPSFLWEFPMHFDKAIPALLNRLSSFSQKRMTRQNSPFSPGKAAVLFGGSWPVGQRFAC